MTEVVVCAQADFPRGTRRLIKVGNRNVAVYNVKGQYYAIDNACYHHGGPLLNGDIEDLGGHPCVKCPWHSYKITLDTGEGLYWGVELDAGQAPRPMLKSKGRKQRTHTVFVRGTDVICVVDATDGNFESDTYAEMAIANREEATPRNSLGVVGGSGAKIHSGFTDANRSGAALGGSKFTVSSASGQLSGGSDWSKVASSGKSRVRICRTTVSSEDGATCTFTFERATIGDRRPLEAGQWVKLRLPCLPSGATLDRTWTVTHVRGPLGGWFSCTVRRRDDGEGGSRWLYSDEAKSALIEVVEIGGAFNFQRLLPPIVQSGGRLLMISAGIGITPMYASLAQHASDPFATVSGPSLNVMHLHSERSLTQMPFCDEFAQLHGAYSRGTQGGDAFIYQLRILQSSSEPPCESRTLQWLSGIDIKHARLGASDVEAAVAHLGPAKSVHVMLCGPPAFMAFVRGVCTGLGVAAIVSEDF